MKLIPLTQGQFAKVDDEDYDFLMKWKWYALKSTTDHYYAVRKGKQSDGLRNRNLIRMHQEVMPYVKGMVIDHIFHDTLDNRKSELRVCTVSQNGMNRVISYNNKSGYKGVSWHKKRRKWRANIKANGVKIELGCFDTKEEAYKSYCEAGRKIHGDFFNKGD